MSTRAAVAVVAVAALAGVLLVLAVGPDAVLELVHVATAAAAVLLLWPRRRR